MPDTLAACVCGQHTDCPDGWHTGVDLPCSCTPECCGEACPDCFGSGLERDTYRAAEWDAADPTCDSDPTNCATCGGTGSTDEGRDGYPTWPCPDDPEGVHHVGCGCSF